MGKTKLKNVDIMVVFYYFMKIFQYNIHSHHHRDLLKPLFMIMLDKIFLLKFDLLGGYLKLD